MPTQLVVHNPMGHAPQVSGKALAPRLDTLNGRTVYIVDCPFEETHIGMKVEAPIEELGGVKMPVFRRTGVKR